MKENEPREVYNSHEIMKLVISWISELFLQREFRLWRRADVSEDFSAEKEMKRKN